MPIINTLPEKKRGHGLELTELPARLAVPNNISATAEGNVCRRFRTRSLGIKSRQRKKENGAHKTF